MGDCLPRTPINRRAKYDAASFIIGGEIRDRTTTNTQNYKQTNTSVFRGTAVYPHISTRASIADRRQSPPLTASAPSEGDWRLSQYILAAARRSVGFWTSGGVNSPKWEIPCPGRPWTIVQNLTPLALSPAEKSVTVQNDKITNKQTNSMCANDNQRLELNKNSVGQHQLHILTQINP